MTPGLASRLSRTFGAGTLRGRLLRGGLGSLGLRLAAMLATLVGSVVLARALGPDGLGVYAIAFAMLSLLGLPVQMGLPTLVLRETARAGAAADWPLMRGIWIWAARRIGMASLVLAAAAVLAVCAFRGLIEDRVATVLLIGLPLVPLVALGRTRGAALRGLHHPVLGQLPEDLLRPVGLSALIVLVGAGLQGGLTPATAMALHVAAAGLAFVVGAVLLLRAQPAGLRHVDSPRRDAAAWSRALWPLALISGLQMLSQTFDVIILGWWHPADEVGIYKIAVSAAGLATVGLKIVALVAAPQMAQMHSRGETDRLARISAHGTTAGLAMTLPVVAVLAIWGRDVLTLFYGAAFAGGYLPMVILLAGQAVNAGLGLTTAILAMTGHETQAMRMLVVSTLANIALNLALSPPFGMVGAAAASSLSILVWGGLFWVFVYRRLGFDSSVVASVRLIGKGWRR